MKVFEVIVTHTAKCDRCGQAQVTESSLDETPVGRAYAYKLDSLVAQAARLTPEPLTTFAGKDLCAGCLQVLESVLRPVAQP